MTYKVVRVSDDKFELRDPNGNVVISTSPPVNMPKDLIDYGISLMDISEKDKKILKVLLKRDYEFVDER